MPRRILAVGPSLNIGSFIRRGVCLFTSLGLISTAAIAAVSPIPLLVEQCLRYDFPSEHFEGDIPPRLDAVKLERQLLGFFNINDRLAYYRQFPLSYDDREAMLQCQLFLADGLTQFIASDRFQSLETSLNSSREPELRHLGKRLRHLSDTDQDAAHKAKLHTAQAAFKRGLKSQKLTLHFLTPECRLPEEKASAQAAEKAAFKESVASYLIKQPDGNCRRQVWQAYQGRTTAQNKPSFEAIRSLRHEQAQASGAGDYARLQLRHQWLSTPERVADFLRSQTQAIDIAPWDLGAALSQRDKHKIAPQPASSLLARLYAELAHFGIRIEEINQKLHRVWLDGRLLGDIYLSEARRPRSSAIRHSVVGQQFGQAELALPSELNGYQDFEALIEAVTQILVAFAKGNHFYLLNTLGETQDVSDIDALWLQSLMTDRLIGVPDVQSREYLLKAYAKQLRVFRAKVALSSYQEVEPLFGDLGNEFRLAFGKAWSQPQDYAFTFAGIIYEGPLYYQALWQNALANFIYQTTKGCQNQQLIFDSLVVNESSESVEKVLLKLLGAPVDADSLIKRIQDVSATQDRRPVHCAI